MYRLIHFCINQPNFNTVCDLFKEGWILDPSIYDGKPLRLENGVVYHLVKYEEGEAPVEEAEARIESIKSVAINEADEWLAQGYEVKDTFAKTVTLVKLSEIEEKKEEAEG